MKERPILMHARSIDGIQKDRKTQTRRIIRIPQVYLSGYGAELVKISEDRQGFLMEGWPKQDREFGNFGRCQRIKCPYGAVGDRLWIRERFLYRNNRQSVVFYAGMDPVEAAGFGAMYGGWKPSIHMPRWASRLTMENTRIRAERVQDISEEDAKAEGIRKEDLPPDPDGFHPPGSYGFVGNNNPLGKIWPTAKEAFAELWDDTNGAGAWKRNDWCWVVDFKRIQQ